MTYMTELRGLVARAYAVGLPVSLYMNPQGSPDQAYIPGKGFLDAWSTTVYLRQFLHTNNDFKLEIPNESDPS